jgi:hypothetical protein
MLDPGLISTDTLFIGLPAVIAGRYQHALTADSAILPVNRVYRYYEDLREAEIDFGIGDLDLLVTAESEIDDQARCVYSAYTLPGLLEWHLAFDLPDDDLYPAALSYCLKGCLGSGGCDELTALIRSRDIENYFPHSEQYAASLFRQMPLESSSRQCHFDLIEMFPRLPAQLERRIDHCSGNLVIDDTETTLPIQLVMSFIDSCDVDIRHSLLQQLQVQVQAAGYNWSNLLTPTDDSLAIGDEQLAELSRSLSQQIKLVPLGRTRLLLLARPEVHLLRRSGQPITPGDFYLIRENEAAQ